MERGVCYEDYLSLLYNARHGVFGPLSPGRAFRLPIHVSPGVRFLELSVASTEETLQRLAAESDSGDKHVLIRFGIPAQDISSKSGRVECWLNSAGVPVKGTIEDVVFFGDLWGERVQRRK